VELAVDVATYRNWSGNWLYVALLDEKLLYLEAKLLQILLREQLAVI